MRQLGFGAAWRACVQDGEQQNFIVQLCAKMFAAQLEICGGKQGAGLDGAAFDGDEEEPRHMQGDDMSVSSSGTRASSSSGASASTTVSGTSTLSSFSGSTVSTGASSLASAASAGADNMSVSSDSSVNAQLQQALLHSTTFLDICLKLCVAETDRIGKLLLGSLCVMADTDDTMIIENVEQLSAETLRGRVAVMEALIVDLKAQREGIMAG